MSAQAPRDSGCRMTGGICACRSGGSYGGCVRERENCCAAVQPLPAAPAPTDEQPRPEQVLRRLLAYRVAGAKLYADDGELQDNTAHPCIDFRRDSVDAIETKMGERTLTAWNALDPELVRATITGQPVAALPAEQVRLIEQYRATIRDFDERMKDPVQRVIAEQVPTRATPEQEAAAVKAGRITFEPGWNNPRDEQAIELPPLQRFNDSGWPSSTGIFCLHSEARAALAARQAPASYRWAEFKDWLASPIEQPATHQDYICMAFNAGRETVVAARQVVAPEAAKDYSPTIIDADGLPQAIAAVLRSNGDIVALANLYALVDAWGEKQRQYAARQVNGVVERDAARLDFLARRYVGASDSERYLPFRVYWGGPKHDIRAVIDEAMRAELSMGKAS